MNAKTRKALEASIEKWVNIRDNGREDWGCIDCPLCGIFLHPSSNICKGCPVMEKTGMKGCRLTPYAVWINHHKRSHAPLRLKATLDVQCPECKRLADEEVKFLEGLREENSDEQTEKGGVGEEHIEMDEDRFGDRS